MESANAVMDRTLARQFEMAAIMHAKETGETATATAMLLQNPETGIIDDAIFPEMTRNCPTGPIVRGEDMAAAAIKAAKTGKLIWGLGFVNVIQGRHRIDETRETMAEYHANRVALVREQYNMAIFVFNMHSNKKVKQRFLPMAVRSGVISRMKMTKAKEKAKP